MFVTQQHMLELLNYFRHWSNKLTWTDPVHQNLMAPVLCSNVFSSWYWGICWTNSQEKETCLTLILAASLLIHLTPLDKGHLSGELLFWYTFCVCDNHTTEVVTSQVLNETELLKWSCSRYVDHWKMLNICDVVEYLLYSNKTIWCPGCGLYYVL